MTSALGVNSKSPTMNAPVVETGGSCVASGVVMPGAAGLVAPSCTTGRCGRRSWGRGSRSPTVRRGAQPERAYPRARVRVRLEFLILSLHPGLRQRCVAPDVWGRRVAGGGAAAIVEEAGRHAGRLPGGAPRRAPAADGDAVAVEEQRAIGITARQRRDQPPIGCESGANQPLIGRESAVYWL